MPHSHRKDAAKRQAASKEAAGGYDVFINNLLEETTAEQLQAFFEQAGKIVRPPRLKLERGFDAMTVSSDDHEILE